MKNRGWKGLSHAERLELYGKCVACNRLGETMDGEGLKCWEHWEVYSEDGNDEAVRELPVPA